MGNQVLLLESLTVCWKEFKHTPDLESKGKFIREGVTFHKQNVASSQRLRVKESKRDSERQTERDGDNETGRVKH